MEQEIKRLMDLLPTLNPASDDYAKVLSSLKNLYWFNQELKDCHECPKYLKPIADEPACNTPEPTPMAEPVPAPVVEKPVAVSKYDYDTVRKECTDAMSKGVNVKDIIAKYVNSGDAAKLTNINAEDYEAFINDVHAEVANA